MADRQQTTDHRRQEIAGLDAEIIRLASRRAELMNRLGGAAGPAEVGPLAAAGPEGLRRELARLNRGPLPDAVLEQLLTQIAGACRDHQEPRRIACLGPAGSFCQAAAARHFGRSADCRPQASVADVFRLVERGQALMGVVPVESSVEGSVAATLDALTATGLKVMAEVLHPAAYCLASAEAEMAGVREVYGPPRALARCAAWLGRNLPGAARREAASGPAAAAQAAGVPGTAALAGAEAARLHGLNLLAEKVNSQAEDLTRYLVVGRHQLPPSGADKTSLLFVARHQPGALAQALAALSEAGVNLTRIESRPTKERPWDYRFFADLEGHAEDPAVAGALGELAARVEHLKVLGSYPRA
jgi:chorismate mutase/prephenate dehydratase